MHGSIFDRFVQANGRVAAWLARIAMCALALIAVVTFCDVVSRKLFNAPFAVTVELTSFAMAVIVFFGVGLVTHEDAHISADILTLRLLPRLRALFAIITNLLALGFLALMSWRLWLYADMLLEKGDSTQVWNIPLWPVALAVAFGSLFLLTGVLLHLIGAWRHFRQPDAPPTVAATSQPYRE
jgi:TRAP-type C4-dicarboxylate transport system permease small subunit